MSHKVSERRFVSLTAVAILLSTIPLRGVFAQTAHDIITQSGIGTGLCVFLGDDREQIAVDLHNGQRMAVHVLTTTPDAMTAEREAIGELNGLVSAEYLADWSSLPYASNLANLIVVEDLAYLTSKGLTGQEIERVLAPFGALYVIGGATGLARRHDTSSLLKATASPCLYKKLLDPRMDEWSHFLVTAENNVRSKDQLVKPPTHLKWSSGSESIGSTAQHYGGIRLAAGKMVYFHRSNRTGTEDEVDRLFCRDANNGTLLWKSAKNLRAGGMWVPMTMDQERLYTVLALQNNVKNVFGAINLSDGSIHKVYNAVSPMVHDIASSVLVSNGMLIICAGDNRLLALDPSTGAVKWKFELPDTSLRVLMPTASARENAVFAMVNKRSAATKGPRWTYTDDLIEVVRLNHATGEVEWRNGSVAGQSGSTLIYNEGRLVLFAASGFNLGNAKVAGLSVLDVKTGAKKWFNNFSLINARIPFHDSPMRGQGAFIRGDSIYLDGGAQKNPVTVWNINDGSWRMWANGTNHRCSRGTACANYMLMGYGTWLDWDFNYQFKVVRRSGCAMGGFFAYGNVYYTPAACGCESWVTGKLGYVAFSSEGSRRVIPDEWRLVASTETDWKKTGETSVRLRKTTAGAELDPESSPVLQDWPDFKKPTGFAAKLRAISGGEDFLTGGTFETAGITFVNHGSRLSVDIREGTRGIATVRPAGRLNVLPLVLDSMAFLGAADGYVYAVDLKNARLAWRFLAAPCDQRIMRAGQLESQWPISALAIQNNSTVLVKAGRHSSIAGGQFAYTLLPATGTILSKAREYSPSDGTLSNPEKGYAIWEELEPGDEAWFGDEPVPEPAGYVLTGTSTRPTISHDRNGIHIRFGSATRTNAVFALTALNGKVLVRQSGTFGRLVTLPGAGLPKGTYVLTVVSGAVKAAQKIQIH